MKITKTLLVGAISAAKKAGEEILKIYTQQRPLNIQTKQDASPVTLADLTAHEIIVDRLLKLTPDLPILSEEDATSFDYRIRQDWEIFWLVDPLDGTKEYINRSGQFTVNIALVISGRAELGVIYVPLKDTLYYAASGLGAHKQIGNQEPQLLQIRPWHLGDDIILVVTRRELHLDLSEQLASVGHVELTYRSSSLKFCLLAEGRGDIYLRKKPIREWDTAAGQCILEQSGGVVLDSKWHPLRYNTKPELLNAPFIALGDSKQLLPLLKMMPMF